jgi:hypothetical protein
MLQTVPEPFRSSNKELNFRQAANARDGYSHAFFETANNKRPPQVVSSWQRRVCTPSLTPLESV